MRTRQSETTYRHQQPKPAEGSAWWTALACALGVAQFLAVGLAATSAKGADYYSAGVYHSLWPRSSESDGLESSRLYGIAATGAAGWHIADQWRAEVEVTARAQEVHGINPNGQALSADGNTAFVGSIHANLAYDVATWGAWTPYTFGGLGITGGIVRQTNFPWRDESGRNLDYWFFAPSAQVGAGLSYAMSELLSLDLSVRYVRPMTVELDYRGDDIDAIFDTIMTGVALRW